MYTWKSKVTVRGLPYMFSTTEKGIWLYVCMYACMYARMSACENEQMCVYPGKTEELDPREFIISV